MRRLLLITLSVLMLSLQLFAQTRTVTGTVTDNQGQPLPNVSVQVKGTTTGTVTDAQGNYTITVPANAKVLVFSAVDMGTKEASIGSQNRITISLQQSERAMQEVVVTGYTRERRSTFTGAATVISGKAVETVPVGSFDQALQGRAPGLLVNSGTGQPGSSPSIRIRGTSSISGQGQPLYIVDGVPLQAADMQTINPNDFETINVLKDASASALYGARGGLGVIVITTKRGRAGQANFGFRTQYGFTQKPQASQFNQMSSREMLAYEEFVGGFAPALTAPGWVYSPKHPSYAALPATSPATNPFAPSKARYAFLLDSLGNNNVDYYSLLFRTGVTQSHEINMSGGVANTRYYMSLNNFNQEGTDRKSKLNRYTLRFNLDNTVGKLTTQLNTTVGYSITDINEGTFYGASGTANPFAMAWRAKPYENPYLADGTLIYGASTPTSPKAIGNLIERSNNSIWKEKQIKGNAGLTLSYKLLNSLTLRNTTGLDGNSNYFQGYINPNSQVGGAQTYNQGYLNESNFTRLQLINTAALVYNNRFGTRHELEAGGYFETLRQWNQGLGVTLYMLDPRLSQTGQNAGSLPIAPGQTTIGQNGNSASSGFGIRSFFANARYSLDNKYTLSGNIRRDGTSRIIKDENKEITTWSAGFTWNAIRESFLENNKVFSDLRLRATYGVVPNIGSIPTGAFGIGSLYSSIAQYHGAQLPAFNAVNSAGSTITGLVPTTANPDLRIETVSKFNIGAEMGFLQNRIRFTVDAYRNITNDLFVSQRLPATSGFYGSSLLINAGSMSNKGLEFDLQADVVRTTDIDVTLRANHSINKNRIEDLGSVTEYPSGTGIIKEGLPIGTHLSYSYLGADPATGRPIYKRADGSPTTSIGEAGQFHEFGSWLPVHQGGFSGTFRFKQFSVDALFSYQFDVRRYNNVQNWVTQGDATYTGAVTQSTTLFTEQWQKPGDVRMLQSPAFSRQFTSYDITDAKFLRFRNLNIAYNLPTGKISKIRSARLYVQAQNLAVWSPWSGLDPEDDNNISLGEFPNPRAVVVGLDINF